MKNKWHGMPPKHCDVCGEGIEKEFVDGKTKSGRWAIMCKLCFLIHGVGLGIGKGQRYSMKVIRGGNRLEWIKVKKAH